MYVDFVYTSICISDLLIFCVIGKATFLQLASTFPDRFDGESNINVYYCESGMHVSYSLSMRSYQFPYNHILNRVMFSSTDVVFEALLILTDVTFGASGIWLGTRTELIAPPH